MLVDSEPVSIVSKKVTETFDVIETEVSESEGELDDTVGGVVSELFEPSSLLLLQEMKVRLKRNMERMMSICLTWFPFGVLENPICNINRFVLQEILDSCRELSGKVRRYFSVR